MDQPKKVPPEIFTDELEKALFKTYGLTRESPATDFYRIPWGTYGKSGKEPLRWIPLCELSNSHLSAIARTQIHIPFLWRWIITDILLERAKRGDIEDECTWNG